MGGRERHRASAWPEGCPAQVLIGGGTSHPCPATTQVGAHHSCFPRGKKDKAAPLASLGPRLHTSLPCLGPDSAWPTTQGSLLRSLIGRPGPFPAQCLSPPQCSPTRQWQWIRISICPIPSGGKSGASRSQAALPSPCCQAFLHPPEAAIQPACSPLSASEHTPLRREEAFLLLCIPGQPQLIPSSRFSSPLFNTLPPSLRQSSLALSATLCPCSSSSHHPACWQSCGHLETLPSSLLIQSVCGCACCSCRNSHPPWLLSPLVHQPGFCPCRRNHHSRASWPSGELINPDIGSVQGL